MREGFISSGSHQLHFTVSGDGPAALLAFHGFGQSSRSLLPIATAVPPDTRIVLFDLYFHGKSQYTNTVPIQKEDWKQTLERFLQQHQVTRFGLYGYSLGARFAMASAEAFTERVDFLFLVAPDGIHENFWYTLATRTAVMRSVFHSLIAHPGPFFTFVHMLHRLRLVNPGVVRFVTSQMETPEKRNRVYHSWVTFRRLRFDVSALGSRLDRYQVALTIIVGRYDRVVPPASVQSLVNAVGKCNFEVLETGHNQLIAESTQPLKTIYEHLPDK